MGRGGGCRSRGTDGNICARGSGRRCCRTDRSAAASMQCAGRTMRCVCTPLDRPSAPRRAS
eukprot:56319-Eustigmatos_ZCMA.PRE.1